MRSGLPGNDCCCASQATNCSLQLPCPTQDYTEDLREGNGGSAQRVSGGQHG